MYGDRDPDKIGEPVRQLLRNAPVPRNMRIDDASLTVVRIICTVYDPKTGSIATTTALILEIAGGRNASALHVLVAPYIEANGGQVAPRPS